MAFLHKVRDSFVSGLLLVAPLAVTLVVLKFLSNWAMIFVDPFVKGTRLATYTANIELLAQALAVSVAILVVALMGYISNSRHSNFLKASFGKFLHFVPLIGTIYLSVRQVAAAIGQKDSRFKKLVLLEFPREGVYSLGLITSTAPEPLQVKSDEELYSVFIPNSPNPTGGRTVLVPESEFKEVDMSVQKGLKLMVTTGIVFEDDELPRQI